MIPLATSRCWFYRQFLLLICKKWQHTSRSFGPNILLCGCQDFDGEEDWFADIMKDDIIELDDSSLNARPISMIPVRPESSEISNHEAQAAMSSVVPFQGTANRRLRLVRQVVTQCRVKGSKPYKAIKMNKIGGGTTSSARWLSNMFSVKWMRQYVIPIFLVTLTLLVMLLSLLEVSQQVKPRKRLLILASSRS